MSQNDGGETSQKSGLHEIYDFWQAKTIAKFDTYEEAVEAINNIDNMTDHDGLERYVLMSDRQCISYIFEGE